MALSELPFFSLVRVFGLSLNLPGIGAHILEMSKRASQFSHQYFPLWASTVGTDLRGKSKDTSPRRSVFAETGGFTCDLIQQATVQ